MRDQGKAQHAVAQTKHTWPVNIFRQIADVFAIGARMATSEVDDVQKVEDGFRNRIFAYGTRTRMTRNKMGPLNQLLSQNGGGDIAFRQDAYRASCVLSGQCGSQFPLYIRLRQSRSWPIVLLIAAGKAFKHRSYPQPSSRLIFILFKSSFRTYLFRSW
jgi:hypothetical protein